MTEFLPAKTGKAGAIQNIEDVVKGALRSSRTFPHADIAEFWKRVRICTQLADEGAPHADLLFEKVFKEFPQIHSESGVLQMLRNAWDGNSDAGTLPEDARTSVRQIPVQRIEMLQSAGQKVAIADARLSAAIRNACANVVRLLGEKHNPEQEEIKSRVRDLHRVLDSVQDAQAMQVRDALYGLGLFPERQKVSRKSSRKE